MSIIQFLTLASKYCVEAKDNKIIIKRKAGGKAAAEVIIHDRELMGLIALALAYAKCR